MFEISTAKKVYIASKLRGDEENNLNACRRYCRIAFDMGVIPCAPQLFFTQFLDDSNENERDLGMSCGLRELTNCDELWCIGPISSGMLNEIAMAKSANIPIRYFNTEMKEI